MGINQDIELLEVYTEDNENNIGIAQRSVVHKFNLWHREIACWIINEKNEILLQRRSEQKKQQPNMLAVTAGHVDFNESPIEAALRELEEELGIRDINEKSLIFIDVFKAENPNNYHFKYVYLLKTDKKLQQFTMQESEVSELIFVSLKELEKMIELPNTELTFAKHFYTPIILNKIKELI